jgi:uncharacterized protein (DUF1778 family)
MEKKYRVKMKNWLNQQERLLDRQQGATNMNGPTDTNNSDIRPFNNVIDDRENLKDNEEFREELSIQFSQEEIDDALGYKAPEGSGVIPFKRLEFNEDSLKAVKDALTSGAYRKAGKRNVVESSSAVSPWSTLYSEDVPAETKVVPAPISAKDQEQNLAKVIVGQLGDKYSQLLTYDADGRDISYEALMDGTSKFFDYGIETSEGEVVYPFRDLTQRQKSTVFNTDTDLITTLSNLTEQDFASGFLENIGPGVAFSEGAFAGATYGPTIGAHPGGTLAQKAMWGVFGGIVGSETVRAAQDWLLGPTLSTFEGQEGYNAGESFAWGTGMLRNMMYSIPEKVDLGTAHFMANVFRDSPLLRFQKMDLSGKYVRGVDPKTGELLPKEAPFGVGLVRAIENLLGKSGQYANQYPTRMFIQEMLASGGMGYGAYEAEKAHPGSLGHRLFYEVAGGVVSPAVYYILSTNSRAAFNALESVNKRGAEWKRAKGEQPSSGKYTGNVTMGIWPSIKAVNPLGKEKRLTNAYLDVLRHLEETHLSNEALRHDDGTPFSPKEKMDHFNEVFLPELQLKLQKYLDEPPPDPENPRVPLKMTLGKITDDPTLLAMDELVPAIIREPQDRVAFNHAKGLIMQLQATGDAEAIKVAAKIKEELLTSFIDAAIHNKTQKVLTAWRTLKTQDEDVMAEGTTELSSAMESMMSEMIRLFRAKERVAWNKAKKDIGHVELEIDPSDLNIFKLFKEEREGGMLKNHEVGRDIQKEKMKILFREMEDLKELLFPDEDAISAGYKILQGEDLAKRIKQNEESINKARSAYDKKFEVQSRKDPDFGITGEHFGDISTFEREAGENSQQYFDRLYQKRNELNSKIDELNKTVRSYEAGEAIEPITKKEIEILKRDASIYTEQRKIVEGKARQAILSDPDLQKQVLDHNNIPDGYKTSIGQTVTDPFLIKTRELRPTDPGAGAPEDFKLTLDRLISVRQEFLSEARAARAKDANSTEAAMYYEYAEAIRQDLDRFEEMGLIPVMQSYNDARSLSRAYHESFTRTFQVKIKERGKYGNYAVAPELMFDQLFAKGGPTSLDLNLRQLNEFNKILHERGIALSDEFVQQYGYVKDIPTAVNILVRDMIAKKFDPETGTLNVKNINKYIAELDRTGVFDLIPNLRRDLMDVNKRQILLESALKRKTKLDRKLNFQKTFSILSGSSEKGFESPARAIEAAWKDRKPEQMFSEIGNMFKTFERILLPPKTKAGTVRYRHEDPATLEKYGRPPEESEMMRRLLDMEAGNQWDIPAKIDSKTGKVIKEAQLNRKIRDLTPEERVRYVKETKDGFFSASIEYAMNFGNLESSSWNFNPVRTYQILFGRPISAMRKGNFSLEKFMKDHGIGDPQKLATLKNNLEEMIKIKTKVEKVDVANIEELFKQNSALTHFYFKAMGSAVGVAAQKKLMMGMTAGTLMANKAGADVAVHLFEQIPLTLRREAVAELMQDPKMFVDFMKIKPTRRESILSLARLKRFLRDNGYLPATRRIIKSTVPPVERIIESEEDRKKAIDAITPDPRQRRTYDDDLRKRSSYGSDPVSLAPTTQDTWHTARGPAPTAPPPQPPPPPTGTANPNQRSMYANLFPNDFASGMINPQGGIKSLLG